MILGEEYFMLEFLQGCETGNEVGVVGGWSEDNYGSNSCCEGR